MPTALEALFAKTKSENRAVLIGYIPAGFPNQKSSKKILKAMIDGGIDAVEIGYPYSDPVMDGPVIQAASEEAIKNGAGVNAVFDLLQEGVKQGVPSMVMSYWSPIEKYGVENFSKKVAELGGSGVITPDLTVEESKDWFTHSMSDYPKLLNSALDLFTRPVLWVSQVPEILFLEMQDHWWNEFVR